MSKRFARGVLSAGLTLIAAAQVASAGTDFELRSGDKSFKSRQAARRVNALHFLLKTECPYCLRYAQEYAAQAPSVAGVTHIFIKPDAEADIAAWQGSSQRPGRQASDLSRRRRQGRAAFGLAADFDFHGTKSNHPALILLGPNRRSSRCCREGQHGSPQLRQVRGRGHPTPRLGEGAQPRERLQAC